MESSSSSPDELPTVDYESLDLSFDDIPPIEANNNNSDPTEFTKPGKGGGGNGGGNDNDDAFLEDDAYILGTLLVRIVAARNLPSVRGGNVLQKLIPGQAGTTNAYASVRFGATTQRTTVIRGTADPLWPRQEFLYMDVTHPALPTNPPSRSSEDAPNAATNALDSNPTNESSSPSPGDPPKKKKAPPTVAKLPSLEKPPSSSSAQSARSTSSNQQAVASSSSTAQTKSPPPLDPPVMTIALFHAAHTPEKYNPSKQQQRGDSDDVFLGMTSMDLTTLLTGKDRSFDDWWPLQGGPEANTSSSVRVVVEYEPSDTAPRPGDTVQFTRYCHATDLYPLLPYGSYQVQSVEGDDVTIGWTSPEGWCSSVIVRRHALVCQDRHMTIAEQIEPHWATMGQRLQESPLVQTVQHSVARVPDEGLISVAQDALTNGQGLLARWFQGGFGTAVEDVIHATNWDGHAQPTAEESLELPNPPSVEEDNAAAVIAVEEEDDNDDASSELDRSILPNMPVCPISQEPMQDPVVAADGHTYERAAIARWLTSSDKSPLTGEILAHKELVPNYMLLSSLREAAATAAAPTPISGNHPPTISTTSSENAVGALALDDGSNDPPSLVDEDYGDLHEEQLE